LAFAAVLSEASSGFAAEAAPGPSASVTEAVPGSEVVPGSAGAESVEVSAAVFRDYPNCADTVGQDWVQWAKNGWLDFVCPMNYTNSAERFIFMTGSQKEALDAVIPMYPGIGVSSSSSRLTPDQCVIQIRAARELGMPGWTLFALTPGTAKLHIPYLKMGVTAGEENKNAEK